MLLRALLFVCLSITVSADKNHVLFKRCVDENATQCAIHNVSVTPCLHGPKFCTFIKDKIYAINVDFTPAFSSENLKLLVSTDVDETGTFKALSSYEDAARSILTAPLEANVRHGFDLAVSLDKHYGRKFPLKVKLWNTNDKQQVCCFTFKVKVK